MPVFYSKISRLASSAKQEISRSNQSFSTVCTYLE